MNRYPLSRRVLRCVAAIAATLSLTIQPTHADDAAAPLKIFATLPDLGNLAREVGGDQVDVTVMLKGGEDAHFLEAKPSFIKSLSAADVFIQNGLELEVGYVPLLLQSARNSKVQPGSAGYVDASRAVEPREVPNATVDRSMGDVHPFGNPHFLLDPLNGVKVADLLRQTFGALRPAQSAQFDRRYADFKARLGVALVGERLANKYDAAKLATLFEHDKLTSFLERQGDAAALAGWLGQLSRFHGMKAVDDHNLWPYFAHRFGVEIIGHLEPKPGVPPTTSHLTELIDQMKAAQVRVIIAAPYYDPRHARFVAENSGAKVASLAHMVGARPGADDYIAMFDYNIRTLIGALGE